MCLFDIFLYLKNVIARTRPFFPLPILLLLPLNEQYYCIRTSERYYRFDSFCLRSIRRCRNTSPSHPISIQHVIVMRRYPPPLLLPPDNYGGPSRYRRRPLLLLPTHRRYIGPQTTVVVDLTRRPQRVIIQ